MKNACQFLIGLGVALLWISWRNAWAVPAQTGTPSPTPQNITLLEAVQSTLNNHPQLRIQRAVVDVSRGKREQNSGLFDPLIVSGFTQARPDLPLTRAQQTEAQQGGLAANDQISDLSDYQFKVDKLFRTGIEITPIVKMNRTLDNLTTINGVSTSAISLVINIPLLRGRGRKAVAAFEEAATREVEASLFDLDELIAQLMAGTTSSYWNLVAAQKALVVAVDAENRGKVYLDNVKALIDADQVPRNDLNEVTANLASRSATRVATEQQLAAARQQLAFAMGLPAQQMLGGVNSTEDFPQSEGQQLPSDTLTSLQYYLDHALHNRGNYLAAERRTVEARILVTAAHNALLPQLNLGLSGGYAGLKEGQAVGNFFASSFSSIPGPSASAGISYTFPAGNHAARGQLLQAEGTATQAEQQSLDLARNISAQITVAIEAVRNAILQLRQTKQAVQSFQSALEGEREKYHMGFGSIVDVLTTEDRLNAALTAEIQAELGYAQALVQFRLATGSLVAPGQAQQTLTPQMFSTLPFTSAPGERP